jgi:signal transduction histidine kinase
MSSVGVNRHMVSRGSHAAPVKLLALFVLLSGIPLAVLGWLGWRVLQQDRALESQRLRERLDNAASLVAREMDRGLTAWEALLPAAAGGQAVALPPGAVFLLIATDGVVQQQGTPLPYYPQVPSAIRASSSLFAAAERQEFREQNLSAAIAAYRGLTASNDPATRAEALMRLARCFRKQERLSDALAAYANLAALGDVPVADSPAALVARRERIALFNATGDANAAAQERTLLTSALLNGRFRIDRPTFEYFHELASVPAATRPTTFGPALAQAVEALWSTWQEQTSGRTAWSSDIGTFVSVWRKTPSGTASMTAGIDALTSSVGDTIRNLQVAAALNDLAGKKVWGVVSAGPGVTKTSRETGLPWSLHVAVDDSGSASSVADSRRNLFVAGFVLMALVVSAASYFVFRAVNRELRVARLQSDFVAAVSHEFRTPLTAMCHLTEILEQGNAGPERLSEYYRALGKESRRLHTMVENLLDFGRMDSGRRTYEFSETDAVELVDHVTHEFADRSAVAARRIEKSRVPSQGQAMIIHADREALALALRNLLDNALKYSPETSPVRLAVTSRNGTVAVAVADDGPGVSAQERREIFRKFARGTAARTLAIKGTGIGLTMANQIVKAHGGRLELDSEPGRGSTFTMVLPAMPR